ncbi:MAG TPA: LysM peptidoglycan-binding domain-containing protein [Chloroflexota bacterium]|nr:LysM peptidoglycan-binding domain-containing protein [Chloroflexota bacterium]
MRDWLRQAADKNPGKTWLLPVAGLGLGAAAAVWLFTSLPFSYSPTSPDSPLTQPPPQAAASAPEPTLAAVQQTQTQTLGATPVATVEASPFAGIVVPPAAAPARQGLVQHTVVAGEVLWQIAEQYQLRPETILWANDIADPDLLLVGQQLTIPATDGVLYTVQPGDRLADVANRYGVDLQAVVASNGLGDANQLQAGVDIFLPGGRPLAAARDASSTAAPGAPSDDQDAAVTGPVVALPDNIDALLGAGWLRAQRATDLYKTSARDSTTLQQLPAGARLERVDGFSGGRIQVRDAGDGRTREAMTGWVAAVDLDVGKAPAARELPQAYPDDTAMDIAQVFAPYRSQLDGSPYAPANCGPTAAGMALEAFGISVPARELRAAALDAQHMHGNGVGTLITALAQVVEDNGLSAMDLRDDTGAIRRWSLDDIRAHVRQGHPVIVQVRYRSLPGRGGVYYFGDHYILITGVVGDGFLYNDPIDIDGLGWDRQISGAALRVAMNASDQRYAYSAVAVGR